ncbi:MAG: UDP-N-acetylmuramoyl-tripeptide--D-alanyl-D-alanine ligase [Rhodothermales bacterium]|nr:UDP-N-acetylmuramoyl-tripeptide--D-alanyl-D-alanine ligase [Rhodothermales bacterium]
MTLFAIGLALSCSVIAWRTWHRLKHFIHMSQLHGYKAGEYLAWLFSRGRSLIVRPSHFATLVIVIVVFVFGDESAPTILGAVAAFAGIIIFASAVDYLKPVVKKPLKFTARAKRLLAGSLFVMTAAAMASLLAVEKTGGDMVPALLLGVAATIEFVVPFAVLLGGILTLPIEKGIQSGYKRKARKKLDAMPHLQVIAITGSYGKTSVKFAIAEILKQRFNVLATPGSFNTPMGICLVINRDLKPEHQVLILEMGARYVGDIQELCDIATPNVGVVTNVGIAHLDTFGNQKTIAREKGTLVENVPAEGLVVLNVDDPLVREMKSRTTASVAFAGLDSAESELRVSEIEYGSSGSSFLLSNDEGETAPVQTPVVGKHNIHNILVAATVGVHFGLRLRQVAHAASRIQPVEHRLQVKQSGDITIIDDAFNSNPVGARNAVDILGQFPGNRRIIVTPGMIELGDRHYDENHALGEAIASNVDVAILIGRNQTKPIQDGLNKHSFPKEQLHVFNSLREAQDFLSSFKQAGDVILYENDLPDQFDEAA